MSEFYIGYQPKAPPGIARRIRGTVLLLAGLTVAAAATFALVQRTILPASFEFGSIRTFTGIIETRPYPALLVARPGEHGKEAGYSRYLLVAEGKHGAGKDTAAFQGRTVRLRGTLLYREGQTMLEVASGSIEPAARPPAPLPVRQDFGEFVLTGEIVDGKCNLGVMNPGSGKVHLDCAVRCLAGGIPAAFVAADFRGRPDLLWLTEPDGTAFDAGRYRSLVARPVRMRGTVKKDGDTLFFEVQPGTPPLPLP